MTWRPVLSIKFSMYNHHFVPHTQCFTFPTRRNVWSTNFDLERTRYGLPATRPWARPLCLWWQSLIKQQGSNFYLLCRAIYTNMRRNVLKMQTSTQHQKVHSSKLQCRRLWCVRLIRWKQDWRTPLVILWTPLNISTFSKMKQLRAY